MPTAKQLENLRNELISGFYPRRPQMPKRIQRQRTKGWRMPEGAVYVGRPGRWGNSFGDLGFSIIQSIQLYKDCFYGWDPTVLRVFPDAKVDAAYQINHAWRERFVRENWSPSDAAKRMLRGHDLACWCPLDKPCHADVLLEIANA